MRIRIWPQYISSMKTKLKSQRKIHQRLAETADKENLCTHYCRTNRVKTDAAATSSDTRIHYMSVNLTAEESTVSSDVGNHIKDESRPHIEIQTNNVNSYFRIPAEAKHL